MNSAGPPEPTPGLRERKKAKTRRTIQEQALRLFAEQGYEGTTVEQIAEAAEVSPSTFFRYFPTKEDVVLRDEYDPLLVEAFLRQPLDVRPVPALRAAMREVLADLYPQIGDEVYRRTKLQMEVPALRARMMEQQLETLEMFSQGLARRSGRAASDLGVRTFAGAFVGATLAAILAWMDSDGAASLPDLLDECLAHLEDGLVG
ncbi:AcrR family transcriptional regulator [Allocatelliglobosispora scoriae]|uniref:AcrR family transcriptional regulator n=1 Tax=Allocatelliglobosispora scoriae TaxID=643052 RepID=A0A841BV41_9ACTN|nr:TetR family transcriptional regulator [Allocatelliglobosispora scoriae]MBB5872064.1 AcrR family transcriptional regulator [Allocatelliglobosispora scoriae]